MAAFSSMGLGQWFIREYIHENNKQSFTAKFLKTQIGFGILFYIFNIAIAYILYPHSQIRILCIILGTNIIFDNFINAIRSLNIAEFRQKKTAAILVIDGFLKLLVGCLLFVYPFSSVILAILMIAVRVLTVGLFILGTENTINLKLIWKVQISGSDLKKLILKNWQFIIIGSVSIIYWRIANIIISKTLSISSVADYEIAFRIFSILQILPVIASATIFPQFVKYYNDGDIQTLKKLYHSIFLGYTIFSFLSYAFIYSYADKILPLAFGNGYPGAAECLQQMFLTFLLLPTVLLQANLIVAIGLEKMDMWFNIGSLILNIAACLTGLYFFKSLSVINYSIFSSFIVFHFFQDVLLVRKKMTTTSNATLYYIAMACFVLGYQLLCTYLNPYILFVLLFGVLICISLIIMLKSKSKLFYNLKPLVVQE